MEGMLMLDDGNNQLLFKDKKTSKQIHIPYGAVTSAFADTQKRQPKAATVASSVPLIYGLPAHFIKTKVRYLTIQYSDPDTQQSGITSFKLENKDILNSVLVSLAEKTGMTQRGDIYVKKRDVCMFLPYFSRIVVSRGGRRRSPLLYFYSASPCLCVKTLLL
jgi:hypothetical protein